MKSTHLYTQLMSMLMSMDNINCQDWTSTQGKKGFIGSVGHCAYRKRKYTQNKTSITCSSLQFAMETKWLRKIQNSWKQLIRAQF